MPKASKNGAAPRARLGRRKSAALTAARAKAKAALRRMSAAEDRRLTKAAASDADNPELHARDFARLRPAIQKVPEIVAAARRGRPRLEKPKAHVSLRLDPDVLDAFKETGPGWQSRIGAVLAREAKRLRRAG